MAAPLASAGAIALRHPRPLARAAAALAAALLALVLLVAAVVSTLVGGQGGGIPAAGLPAGARPFLAIYADAAAVYQVSPFLLMAVHEDETDFSRSALPGGVPMDLSRGSGGECDLRVGGGSCRPG